MVAPTYILRPDLITLVKINAAVCQVDPYILAAIVMTETSGKSYLARYEENWSYFVMVDEMANKNGITTLTERKLQQFSMGPGQVMGSVARELGYTGPLGALMTDNVGMEYAAKNIERLAKKYSNVSDLFAAYNAGSPRKDPETQEYVNQAYVDKANYWLNYFAKSTLLKTTS